MNPGTRGVKEVYLNLMHKVRGQPDKKVSVSLSAGEMVVLRRLSEVNLLPPFSSWREKVVYGHGTGLAQHFGVSFVLLLRDTIFVSTGVHCAVTCTVPLLSPLQCMLDMSTIPLLLQFDNHSAPQTQQRVFCCCSM